MIRSATPPVTTLTVFSFAPRMRAWAFVQMGLARPLLRSVPGMRFRKLLGTGRGIGFTLRPDWGRYALLAVWDSEEDAGVFLRSSRFMERYRRRAMHEWTTILKTISAHGAWDGLNPFLPSGASSDDGRVGVLTRATIRPGRLRPFWKMVAPISEALERAEGLECSIGIGEIPFIRQATLSIWSDHDAMKRFAYADPVHRGVVERTRAESWYAEELFARFAVIHVSGQLR
ncbi:MAG TPA: spheroidene monooxygenase [Candidatus Kapabacteria bacterium]|nr:spheroidene monooxygenase [Candidatus Kapabacteria bacterium]